MATSLVFTLSFILAICGLALIILGSIIMNNDTTIFSNKKYVTSHKVLIVVGLVIFVIAFIGCYGTVRENYWMLVTFGVLLLPIALVVLVEGILVLKFSSKVKVIVKEDMNSTIAQQKEDDKIGWDRTQFKYQCCGVDGPNDYTSNGISIPKSCCSASEATSDATTAYKKGCYAEMLNIFMIVTRIGGGFPVVIAAVALMVSVLAFRLAFEIKREV